MHLHHWQDWAGVACALLIMITLAWLAIAAALNSGSKPSDDEWAAKAQRRYNDEIARQAENRNRGE